MTHSILISVGSNIEKETNVSKGLDLLQQAFGQLALSVFYESDAVGFTGNTFLNLVVGASTVATVGEVIQTLKNIEVVCGRIKNSEKFSDRTLDLDLLTYDDVVCDSPVTLPRDEILYNAFVLRPMADLAPNALHPQTNTTYAQLWHEYDKSKQRLWPSQFTWSNKVK